MNRVVITGMGVISPVGNDLASFWESISQGICGIGYITRFDTADFKVKIAAEVKGFDPAAYMEPGEARRTDPYTHYAIAAAQQAMDDSGLMGQVAPERLGVYIGSGIGGLQTLTNECQKFILTGPRKVSPLMIPMMIGNIAAGSIAIRFQAQGPCLPSVTACATSSNTIGEAYRAIRHGYADAVLAGGSEAAILPLAVAGFANCMALSTRNDPLDSSIPFDIRRDGFVMGEGAGMLVLEEYEHAKTRGANIYAEIKGYGHTCDAFHITAPHPEGRGAVAAIRGALEEAGGLGGKAVYINAHGTSTPLNDRTETMAIKQALGEQANEAYVSSSKSMIGHMLGAAGAAEAIISVLALNHQLVPPTIGLKEPDPECDLNYVPGRAVNAPLELVLSTSLGFGGHNACLAFAKE
ncbi:MAG: beta-ketoacyl-ACP synthase II [Clostridiales bacterium]|nr:beta-ketoacyl-ACP synthase II [Clostridiales bacterium]